MGTFKEQKDKIARSLIDKAKNFSKQLSNNKVSKNKQDQAPQSSKCDIWQTVSICITAIATVALVVVGIKLGFKQIDIEKMLADASVGKPKIIIHFQKVIKDILHYDLKLEDSLKNFAKDNKDIDIDENNWITIKSNKNIYDIFINNELTLGIYSNSGIVNCDFINKINKISLTIKMEREKYNDDNRGTDLNLTDIIPFLYEQCIEKNMTECGRGFIFDNIAKTIAQELVKKKLITSGKVKEEEIEKESFDDFKKKLKELKIKKFKLGTPTYNMKNIID